MLFIDLEGIIFQTKEVGIPFAIKANLLALIRKGKKKFVLLFDLKILDKSFKSFPDGLFIWLHILFIASAP